MSAAPSPLDVPIAFTFFDNFAATTKREELYTLRGIAPRIRTVTKGEKSKLPWLKAAIFGDLRTEKNSLRHDANVIAVTGCEADYDENEMTFDEALERLEKQGVASLIYTSPSHAETRPRWRVVCPFSEPLAPEKREKMVGRLNGLFRGIFAGESFTLSQAYYYGSVNHNPAHRVELVDGTPIDLHDELDEVWTGRPHTTTKTNGAAGPTSGPVDEGALLAEITSGASYHASAVRLLGRWAKVGVPYMEARKRLLDAFDAVGLANRDARWSARRGDADRCLDDIYGVEARKKDQDSSSAEWRDGLIKDGRGKPLAILANAACALRLAPELAGLAVHDQMARHALITRTLPSSKMAVVLDPRPMTDQDVAAIQEWLQHHGLPKIGKEIIHQAADLVAHENSFHPVRTYLLGLRWDGVERLYRWLTDYLGAENTPYTRAIGRLFLVAMVARIMRPGCKVDYMLVLEGPQGALKSTACRILASDWFSDALPDLHRGDAVRVSQHLRGKWVIEIAELSAISKAEASTLKAFITQTEERYLPKWGRVEVIEPRQCVFIGTTNESAYLRDETGGRRFWPVLVGKIDIDTLIQDRDQLFAEALTAFQAGERWWPTREFEREHIEAEQESRFVVDEWENLIGAWLDAKTTDENGCTVVDGNGRPTFARHKCTVSEAADYAIRLGPGRITPQDQRRITAALKRLGWEPARDKTGRWWERPT